MNCLVDTLVVFLLAYVASKAWTWYVFHWHYPYLNFGWFFFGSMFVYYTIAEGIFRRTLGKLVSYTHVVTRNNGRPSFLQILVRSLVRLTIIDLFFIPFLEKPLHDHLSRTEVVEK